MTKLSVNINKIATLRNARGGNTPNVLKTALDIQSFGADGITVHPRPDQRHIRYTDVHNLKQQLSSELNIEGNPTQPFIDLVLNTRPAQVTLVPDAPDALTSSAGWDTKTYQSQLTPIIANFKQAGIRTSIFVNPDPQMVAYAAKTGADRIELYTEPYATLFPTNPQQAIAPFIAAAKEALNNGLDINAGHDLSLLNLDFFLDNIPYTKEVSIGHQLICDALYLGLHDTVNKYLAISHKTR